MHPRPIKDKNASTTKPLTCSRFLPSDIGNELKMSLIIIYNYRTLGRPGLTLQRLTLSSLVQRVWLLQIQLILSSGLALMRDSKLKSLKSRLPFSFPKDTFFLWRIYLNFKQPCGGQLTVFNCSLEFILDILTTESLCPSSWQHTRLSEQHRGRVFCWFFFFLSDRGLCCCCFPFCFVLVLS